MSTKNLVLKNLYDNRNEYISGENLANKLNISRTSIWKAINSLKNEGFKIVSSTNKGYKLDINDNKLSQFGIRPFLNENLKNIDIQIFDIINSTNIEAKKQLISKNLDNFSIIISNEQVKGKGRTGKSFYSPKDLGIYLSIVLIPNENFNIKNFDLITIRAAVAVFKTIQKKLNIDVDIKWVNDLFFNGKKICGILSELNADFESKNISSIIVGIGLNYFKDNKIPKHLNEIIGSVDAKNVSRNEFIAELLNEFYNCYYNEDSEKILEIYKKYQLLLNKMITFNIGKDTLEAKVVDINENGNLVVYYNNSTQILSSGEVKIKNYEKNNN